MIGFLDYANHIGLALQELMKLRLTVHTEFDARFQIYAKY